MAASFHDEHEWLARLKQSDEHAFAAMYDAYWKSIFVPAANKLGNNAEAEEIVQEIFLDIWQRRETLHIETSLSAYLAGCLKYKVLTVLARRSHAQRYQTFALSRQEPDQTTENWLRFEELKAQLVVETEKLPEKCRLVFRLSREKGLSQKQIAVRLGISEKTVESHLSKALRNLRVGLNQFLGSFFF